MKFSFIIIYPSGLYAPPELNIYRLLNYNNIRKLSFNSSIINRPYSKFSRLLLFILN